MLVIADSSPLILLARIDCLELLRQLYGEIRVPEAVYGEIVEHGDALPASEEVRSAEWIVAREVSGERKLLRTLEGDLGRGEAQAIALAAHLEADLLLMDEREGRQAAQRLGISVKGTLGLLLEGKRAGYLEEIGPLIEALLEQGAWLSTSLRRAVLTAAGEKELV